MELNQNKFAMSGDIFDCHNLGNATGVWRLEARDIAKHSTMYRTASTTKHYCLQISIVPGLIYHDLYFQGTIELASRNIC